MLLALSVSVAAFPAFENSQGLLILRGLFITQDKLFPEALSDDAHVTLRSVDKISFRLSRNCHLEC